MSTFLVPNAFAADTTPPQLLDFSIQDYGADISKSDRPVVVRFILSDDSEIETPKLLLKSLSTTQMTPFASVKELSRSGKLISYEATAIIKVGQSPRFWEWVLYPLKDSLGNTNSIFGPGDSWRTQIEVTDEEYNFVVARCENDAKEWNKLVQKFLDFEARHPGAPELAVARLKSTFPIEKVVGEVICSKNQLRGDYFQLFEIFIAASDKVETRIYAEQEAKREAEDQAALEKAEADWKAKQEADEKAAADLKAKQDAELKAKQDAAAKAAAAKAAATKKTTITCIKGKLTKKVTAVKPVCPKGYKKK